MTFAGKRIIVIGAGSGIGRAIALAAVRAGAQVVLGGRNAAALEETAALSGHASEVQVVDAGNEENVVTFFRATGMFDHLVSTIGGGAGGPIGSVQREDVERAMAAKLWAPILLVKYGVQSIREGGSFTFFSGIRGARPAARSSIASMVNCGLEGFARAMAIELGPIRVNVISPGIVDSGAFWERLGAEGREKMFADFAARSPARRVGAPEDQAAAVLFAMGNPFLTGAVLPVDGGALLM